MIFNLSALQLGHRNGVHFRWCRLTVAKQFTGIRTSIIRATEIFAKPPGLQLHLRGALIALECWAVVSLNFELPRLDHVPIAIWVVTADMELLGLINQIAIHGSIALRATLFC